LNRRRPLPNALQSADRPGALVLDHPLIIEVFLLAKLAAREHEVFAVILLDSERRLIEYV
jgi:DNA repair protein RadC